jgi:hypothetical protein
MANYGLGLGAFTQGFAGGLGLGQKFQDAQRRNDDRAAIDKINSDARTAFDSDVAAGKATADQWNDRFNSVVLPQVQQEYIRRGDLAGAREASELAQTEISKQGRSLFGHAMTAATAGDMDGALTAFGKLATLPGYGPAGWTLVGTRKVAGADGKPAGYAVDYRDGAGKTYTASFKDPEAFMIGLESVYAPEARLKEMIAARRAAQDNSAALSLYKDKAEFDFGMDQRKAQAGLGVKPVVTEVYDPKTGQPQVAIVNPSTGDMKPVGGPKAPPAKKPVPAAIQNAEAEDLYGVQNIAGINGSLEKIRKQIDAGSLQLGPLSNFISGAKNAMGISTRESANYASFMATLEKLRNDSLRLNKGVQTEGDAVRAWDELIKNVTDPKVVKQRIAEITRYNNTAAEYRRNVIQQRRYDNGLEPLDVDRIVVPLPQDPQPTEEGTKGKDQGRARAGVQGGQSVQSAQSPAIPAAATAALLKDPKLAAQFDEKYGVGASARVLGGQ